MDANELQAQLANYTGSETFTRHGLHRRVLMTEGVVYLATQAQAFWLLDAIVSYLPTPTVQCEGFQVWTLTVDAAKHATLVLTDGNSKRPIITQEFHYTDFPLAEVVLWLVQGGDMWTLMLQTEY